MQLQRLSQHRLLDRSHEIGPLPSNEQFLLMESTNPNFVKNYYVVEKNWKGDAFRKVVPLAHIKMSPVTGEFKVVAWQPEFWNLSNSDEMKKQLVNLVSNVLNPQISQLH